MPTPTQRPLFTLSPTPENYIREVGGGGILDEADVPELNDAEARVLELLSDNRWHSATEIIHASRQREGLRRMRELRKRGHTIERRRGANRDFEYRLVAP